MFLSQVRFNLGEGSFIPGMQLLRWVEHGGVCQFKRCFFRHLIAPIDLFSLSISEWNYIVKRRLSLFENFPSFLIKVIICQNIFLGFYLTHMYNNMKQRFSQSVLLIGIKIVRIKEANYFLKIKHQEFS